MLEIGAGGRVREWLRSVFRHSENGQELVSKLPVLIRDSLQLLLHLCKPVVASLE